MRKKSLDTQIKELVIATDTREQLSYKFGNTAFATLPYADYSVVYRGKLYLDKIAIERKSSVSELYSATGRERDRWERELEKMKSVKFKWVLCEFNFMDIVNAQPPGKLEASCVYGSICSWQIEYGIPFIFAGNRANARGLMWKLFYEFVKKEVLKK